MAVKGFIDQPYSLTKREAKLVREMHTWSQEAACAETDPDPGFLAERTNNPKKNQELEQNAKEICGWCPVQVECLNHALRLPERGGIWGGLNDAERDLLFRKLRKANPEMWRINEED